jgi:hypothetical protein
MTEFQPEAIAPVIAEALSNKYTAEHDGEFVLAFAAAWSEAVAVGTEAGLKALLRPAGSLVADTVNHVVAFHLIERFWIRGAGIKDPIRALHRVIYGLEEEAEVLRKSVFVTDFGDDAPPTPPHEIPGALRELELLVERFTPIFTSDDTEVRALFLAHLFSALIRVHPFEDGNGRTARLLVQYCQRRWGRPYLPIPKVRNDPSWRDALMSAVAGDLPPLIKEFHQRLHEITL